MGFFRRLFSATYRRARAAEAKGQYREAATLYAQIGAESDAAQALLNLAEHTGDLEARVAALLDSLRWLPRGSDSSRTVRGRVGRTLLDQAQGRGVHTPAERQRLRDAAEHLEAAGRFDEAATAFERLEQDGDVVRCLKRAGAVERLERFLDDTTREEDQARRVHGLVRDYEMHMLAGARHRALRVLEEATGVDPDDSSVRDLLHRLRRRLPEPFRVELMVDGKALVVVGRMPLVIGRADADLNVRGASVSRKHLSVRREDDALWVRDLDSRNGTLISGVAIDGEVRLTAQTRVGLGEDAAVYVGVGEGGGLLLEVVQGLDSGTVAMAGDGSVDLVHFGPLDFPEGRARICFDGTAMLNGAQCLGSVELLVDDRLERGGHVLEVRR